MHFNFTFAIGDLISAFILGALIHIITYLRKLEVVLFQHELMWEDYMATHQLSGELIRLKNMRKSFFKHEK